MDGVVRRCPANIPAALEAAYRFQQSDPLPELRDYLHDRLPWRKRAK